MSWFSNSDVNTLHTLNERTRITVELIRMKMFKKTGYFVVLLWILRDTCLAGKLFFIK